MAAVRAPPMTTKIAPSPATPAIAPMIVGTTSVEKSEVVASLLRAKGVKIAAKPAEGDPWWQD